MTKVITIRDTDGGWMPAGSVFEGELMYDQMDRPYWFGTWSSRMGSYDVVVPTSDCEVYSEERHDPLHYAKKHMTLGEQVRDAQKVVSGWSSEKRASVRLEGPGIQSNRTELEEGATTERTAKESLVERLEKRAAIRRQISTRKSVQEGKPDRIADLLEEAAKKLRELGCE